MKVRGERRARIGLRFLVLGLSSAVLSGCLTPGPESFSVTVVNDCPTTVTVGVAEDDNGGVSAQWARFTALSYGEVLAPGESEEFSLLIYSKFDFVAVLGPDDSLWFKVFAENDIPHEYVLSPEDGNCPG